MKLGLATLAALCVIGACPAWADGLDLVGVVQMSGNGFGGNGRSLTISSNKMTESGCIAPGLTAGPTACYSSANAGGDEANPISFPKQAAPTLGSLGITQASQVGILFDAVQPQHSGNNSVNIDNLTLKLYDSSNTVIFSASGSWVLPTNPGNGSGDYLFVLDPSAWSAFNAAVNGNTNDALALESTLSFGNKSSGPDSYELTNIAATPEPGSLVLMATGLLGLGFLLRRKPAAHACREEQGV